MADGLSRHERVGRGGAECTFGGFGGFGEADGGVAENLFRTTWGSQIAGSPLDRRLAADGQGSEGRGACKAVHCAGGG